MNPNGADAKSLIADLVSHHVAVTSTLPVFEQDVAGHAPLWPQAMAVHTPEAREAYLYLGSIAPGKDADLLVVKGDPSRTITDIQNVELVFKDGVGYDPAALLQLVRNRYGEY